MRFFFPLFLILIVSCTRPSSYEQFVRVEDAADGVYEFAVEMADSAATYDLSFYTAPLDEPLQLEVAFSDLHETVWFPAGQHRALYRSGIIIPTRDTSAPAGPSLFSAENVEGTVVLPPTFLDSGQKQGRSQEKSGDLPYFQPKTWKVQVKPINPPEGFRGLGIICKTNYGTR